MRLVPLNAFYLRAFAVLFSSVLGLLLLCWMLASGLNAVRDQAFIERLAAPVLAWAAGSGERIDAQQWASGTIRLVAYQADEVRLSAIEKERLSYGQAVLQSRENGMHLLWQLPDGQILTAYFREVYRGSVELMAALLARQLSANPVSRDQALQQVREQTPFRISVVSDPARLPDSDGLDALMSDGHVWRQPDAGSRGSAYVRLDDGVILQVQGPSPFDAFRWPVVMALFITLAGGLALTVWLMLSGLYERLRSVETTASRIARGELDARVRVTRMDAIGRLGEAFNGMAEQIQRLVAIQREMIHAVSHELRTPVARIRFGVQMIEDCIDNAPMLQKQLTGIDGDIQELDELIDEILTYARLEQGGPILAFQDTHMGKLVEQVVAEQSLTKPDLKIHAVFEGDSARWMHSDTETRYLHRAIQNLVGNATRYAKDEVLVRCQFERETCRVDVEDNGAGVPEKDWEKVFVPFARLDDSRTRKSGGYGLGLSIVRRILYWHGGQAFLSRSPSLGGARFSLVWPRKQVREG